LEVGYTSDVEGNVCKFKPDDEQLTSLRHYKPFDNSMEDTTSTKPFQRGLNPESGSFENKFILTY